MTKVGVLATPDVSSKVARTTIVHSSLNGTDATLWDRIKAHICISVLLVWWIGGCASPIFLAILFYCGYYKTVFISTVIAAIPYVTTLNVWGWLRWFVGRGMSHFAYYAPYGVACHYMTGSREALMVQTEEDYKRKRDARRRGLPEPECKGPLPQHKPIILTINPHGIFPATFWQATLANPEVFRINPRITYLVSSLLTKAPYWNYLQQWLGQFGPASKEFMTSLMEKGRDIGLIPGGFEEASVYEWGKHKLFLKTRKGFIKYALQYGYDVVPMYSFGEERSYRNIPGFYNIRLWLNKFQIPGAVPMGKFLALPYSDHRMDVFFGSPLHLPHISEPSSDDVDKWHGVYVDRVKELFEAGKDIAKQPDAKLEIM